MEKCSSASLVISCPIAKQAEAAGEGAFKTWIEFSLYSILKSSIMTRSNIIHF
jgi:hypothetical protein